MSTPVDIRLLLTAYADGALDESERLRVEAAVAEDPTLAAELAAIREQQQVLALLLPLRPAPEALDGQRRGRVLAEAAAATWVPAKVPRLRWPWLVAGLAASMVVGLPLLTISIGMTLPMMKVVEGLSGGDVDASPIVANAPPMRVSRIEVPASTMAPMVQPPKPKSAAGGNSGAFSGKAERDVTVEDEVEKDGKEIARGREEAAGTQVARLESLSRLPSEQSRLSSQNGVQSEAGRADKTKNGVIPPAGAVLDRAKADLQSSDEGRLVDGVNKKDSSEKGSQGRGEWDAVRRVAVHRDDHDRGADLTTGEAQFARQAQQEVSQLAAKQQTVFTAEAIASSSIPQDETMSFPGPDLDIPEPQTDVAKAVSHNLAVKLAEVEQAPQDQAKSRTDSIYGANGDMVADSEIGGQEYQYGLAGEMFQVRTSGGIRGGGRASLNLPFPLALQRPVVLRGNVPLSSYVSNFSRSQVLIDREVPADLAIPGSAQPRPAALALVNAARCQNLQVHVQGEALAVTRQVVPQDPTQTFGLTLEDFKKAFGTTPMQDIAVNQQQTFSLDADTASFVGCVAQVAAQQAVDPATVRVEHFVNAVPMDLPEPTGTEAFALYAEGGPSPFAAGRLAERTALVAVGVVGRAADAAERRPLNLVLAVDTSGSMAQPGGLQRLRLGLTELLPHLRTDDKIAVITFADRAVVALPPVSGDATAQVQSTLAALRPDGATNAAEGLALAYQVAGELAAPGRETRVVLATDGATVTGPAATAALARVAGYRSKGITLLVLALGDRGAGAGLGTLADKANGQQVAVTSDAQAQSLFRTTLLPERLQVLARDAKAQVTWNPARVSHARLVGYEERRLEAKDFRNDAVDAGELSQAARATALFEVVLVEGAGGPLGQAAVRYLDTRLNQVVELSCPLPGDLVKTQGSTRLRLAACAAEAGELLQQGWWSNVRGGTWPRLEGELQRLPVSTVQQQLLSLATNMRAHGPQGEP